MLKKELDSRIELRKYLFRRGYVITNRNDLELNDYPFYGNWSRSEINDVFYLYTQNEQHSFIVSNGEIKALLIGHAYDPFTMEIDENVLLKKAIERYQKSKDDFFDYISELTGIHLIVIFDRDSVVFVQDCSGMQMCCYGKCDANIYITSNSALIEDIDSPIKNKFVHKLLQSKSYRHGSKYLPGDLTPYEHIHRLGPNLYLQYKDDCFTIDRFYPSKKHEMCDEKDKKTIERIAELIKNSVTLCTKKWNKPAISLSGGVDSRTTLSSAVGNYDKFYYYSFESKPQEQNDAEAAHNICKGLGLPHEIHHILPNNEDYQDFELYKRIITHNSTGISTPKDNEIRKYIYLSTLDMFDVELKSWASEIGRAFWERRYGIQSWEKLTPRHLSIFQTRYFGEPSLLRQSDKAYQEFMRKSKFIYPMHNYEDSDIFYWEYRFGSWGTIVYTGQNIFNFEVTMPMNNRKIMDMFLWYPHDFRRNDCVNYGVIQENNPELLDIGNRVHNDYLDKKRLLIERLYYYYRTILYRN